MDSARRGNLGRSGAGGAGGRLGRGGPGVFIGTRDETGKRLWPDWRGETVLIAASGPSQRQEDIEAARGKAVVLTINETWRLAPWAAALYACDERWWRLRGPSPAEFGGLRFIGKGAHPGCIPCGVEAGRNPMIWDGWRLGAGGNSGFQAVNLAAACGARRIVLTGFDMMPGETVHWHGDHAGEMTNPTARMLANCALHLDAAAAELATRGPEVLNASRATALKAYRRVNMVEALA